MYPHTKSVMEKPPRRTAYKEFLETRRQLKEKKMKGDATMPDRLGGTNGVECKSKQQRKEMGPKMATDIQRLTFVKFVHIYDLKNKQTDFPYC